MPTRQHQSSRLARRVVACLAIGIVLTACSDDDSDDSSSTDASTTTAAPAEAVCADRDALQSSVESLTSLDVSAEGTNGLEAALSDVKDDLSALEASVSDALQPQVQALQDGVDDLEAAAADLDSGGASAVVAAVSTVSSAAATLLDSLSEGECG